MGRKCRVTYEQRLKACEDYLAGRKSALEISSELKLGKRSDNLIRKWAEMYQTHGAEALRPAEHNNHYSKELKLQIVQEYLAGNSYSGLTVKYNIRSKAQIQNWVKKYNSHMELKDYSPEPEVYMADRKKTTIEERKEIVRYCIDHNNDYKGTASRYGCSYAQVYDWVRKYRTNGDDALQDRRGKHKTEEELSDTEKMQLRIRELEEQLHRAELENEILKKIQAIERKW